MPNTSTAYYFALLEYTTLGSTLHLPLRWRLLEGLTAIAGVLTFAWSTGVLLALAQTFRNRKYWACSSGARGAETGRRPRAPPAIGAIVRIRMGRCR